MRRRITHLEKQCDLEKAVDMGKLKWYNLCNAIG